MIPCLIQIKRRTVPEGLRSFLPYRKHDVGHQLLHLEYYARNMGCLGIYLAMFSNGIGYTLEFQEKPTKKQLKALEHLKLEPTDY
jgi:hypothetical protein